MDVTAPARGAAPFLGADRVASLSDTIFGVAMTLLATTLLPEVLTLKGSALDLVNDVKWQLLTVMFGFAVSGSYWVVQQRRLAMTAFVTVRQTLLHIVFLFLIVLLPLSTGLWGRGGVTRSVVMVYGTHLTCIALVNLLLWIDVHRSVAAHAPIVRSGMALVLFVAALAVGTVSPLVAQLLWFVVFATSLLTANVTRRLYGP